MFRRLLVGILVGLVAITIIGMNSPLGPRLGSWLGTRVAYADGHSWIIERMVKAALKHYLGDPEMSDEELARKLEKATERVLNRIDRQFSEETIRQNITKHCWHVYVLVSAPEVYEGVYYNGLIPGEYLEGTEADQLELCVRNGYVPMPGTANVPLPN